MNLYYCFFIISSLIIIYTIIPHLYTRSISYINDDEYNLPTSLEPNQTIKDFYDIKTKSQVWGSPVIDGPDKFMPDTCKWVDGMLQCKNQNM